MQPGSRDHLPGLTLNCLSQIQPISLQFSLIHQVLSSLSGPFCALAHATSFDCSNRHLVDCITASPPAAHPADPKWPDASTVPHSWFLPCSNTFLKNSFIETKFTYQTIGPVKVHNPVYQVCSLSWAAIATVHF